MTACCKCNLWWNIACLPVTANKSDPQWVCTHCFTLADTNLSKNQNRKEENMHSIGAEETSVHQRRRKSIFTSERTTMPDSWHSKQPNQLEMQSMVFNDYDLEDNKGAANINSFIHIVRTDRFKRIAFVIMEFMLLFMITKLSRLNSSCERMHSKIMGCLRPIFRRIRNASKVSHVPVLLLIQLLVVVGTAIVSRIFIVCILRPIVEMILLIDAIISASYK